MSIFSSNTKGRERKKYVCEICDKVITNLKGHKLSHTSERPFKCKYCDNRFKSNRDLAKHSELHTGQNKYSCSVCSNTFPIKGYLNIHMKIHSERSFECDHCDKTFLSKENVKKHKRRLLKLKPFVCEQCNKAYDTKYHLSCHNKVHTGERPFNCLLCDKSFSENAILKRHVYSIHTKEKLFPCDVGECQERFPNKNMMFSHKKWQHTKAKGSNSSLRELDNKNIYLVETQVEEPSPAKQLIKIEDPLFIPNALPPMESNHNGNSGKKSRECPVCSKFVVNFRRHVFIQHSN